MNSPESYKPDQSRSVNREFLQQQEFIGKLRERKLLSLHDPQIGTFLLDDSGKRNCIITIPGRYLSLSDAFRDHSADIIIPKYDQQHFSIGSLHQEAVTSSQNEAQEVIGIGLLLYGNGFITARITDPTIPSFADPFMKTARAKYSDALDYTMLGNIVLDSLNGLKRYKPNLVVDLKHELRRAR